MTGLDPALIKPKLTAGSGGQPPTSETFVEVPNLVESELDSSMTESNPESKVESPHVTPSASVRNNG